MVDDILQQLRKDGHLEKEGEFRLDPEKAREKLRLFRLPDPHRWVLEIVSAANLLGATKVEFEVDADEVEAIFDGLSFHAEDLSDLFNAAFRQARSQRDLAAKQLAIGFTAAEALDPSSFILESGTSRLILAPGEPRVEVIPARETTRIYFRQTFRARHLVAFFKNLNGSIAEKTYLKDLAKYSDTIVMLDKVRISFPFNFGGQPAHAIVEARGTRGHIRILPDEKTYRTHLTQFGVLILTQTRKDYPGAETILDCPDLHRDISNASFIKDKDFAAAMELSRQLYYEGVYNLYKNIPSHQWYQHGSLYSLVVHVVEVIAEQRHRLSAAAPILVELGGLFEAVAMWPMADRPDRNTDIVVGAAARTSLARVREAKKLYISTESYPLETIPGKSPVILVTKRHILDLTVAELETYLGIEVEDVTQELQQAGLVSRNRSAWSSRSWPTSLSSGQCIRTLDSRHGVYSISVGLAHEKAPPSTVSWVKDGRLLCQTAGLFDVLISGPVQENSDFSGPNLSEQNKKLVFVAVNEIHRLFLSVSTLTSVEPEQQIRRAGRAYFAALASQTLHRDLLTSLEFGDAINEYWSAYAHSGSPLVLGAFKSMGVSLDAVVGDLGDFAELRIFERVDGKGSHSFSELVTASKKSRLLVVKESDRDQLFARFSSVPTEGTFIWTNSAMDRALYAVFGEDVKPGLDEIMAFSQSNAFIQRNIRSFSIEQPARYTILDNFEASDCDLIMAWRAPGPGTRNQFTVRYFYEARILEEDSLSPISGEFLVYARGPAIEPNTDYSGVDRSKKRTKLQLELVRHAYEQLLEWLAQQFEAELKDRSPATAEVLQNLLLLQPRKLHNLRFLTTSSGERVSPKDVQKWPGPLAFSESPRVVLDFIPPESPGVLMTTRAVLEILFPKTDLVDCSAKEGLIERIQRNREAFLARPLASILPKREPLAQATFVAEGMTVHLWMLSDADPGTPVSHMSVNVMFQDRVLCEHTIQVPFGRFSGVIHGTSILADPATFDRMAEVPEDLDATLLACAQVCLNEWISGEAGRDLLVWYLSRMNDQTKEIWPLAYDKLRQASVFPLCDGTRISWNELVEKQPPIFWSRSADELNGLQASQVVWVNDGPSVINLFSNLDWRHVNAAEVRPVEPATTPGFDTRQLKEQANQELGHRFLAVGGIHSAALLSKVGAIGLRQLGGRRLFAYIGDKLVMDVNHPIGLAVAHGDSELLPFAVSSLYSFLGAVHPSPNTNAELELHRELVTRLIQDSPRS